MKIHIILTTLALSLLIYSAPSTKADTASEKTNLASNPPVDTNSISHNAQALFEKLKPGMTRAEVEKHFEMDGGLSIGESQRYFIRDKKFVLNVIMVEISFHPVGMDNATFADPAKKAAWFRNQQGLPFHPDDVITKIGTPYYSSPSYD